MKRDDHEEKKVPQTKERPKARPETEERPAPGIKHEPEPDAENVVPAKHKPGTL